MKYEILHKGAFPLVECHLNQGEKIQAESDAMVAMDTNLDVQGKMHGGVLGGLARKFLTNESFFLQELVAKRGAGKALFAPRMPGDIIDVDLDGTYGLVVQKGGFLAATEGIMVETKVENLVRGFFSGVGVFVIRMKGTGTAFISSWGAIHIINLGDNEEVIIDNGHLVAWPDYMNYTIEKASSSWFSSLTSGEILVCRFKGPGPVLIQTRNFNSFTSWIVSLFATKQS